ncbi:MarR family winged helix-turn-helix transcriptional regulator [Nocardia pseudovaccinii]|uniref:MarR family winged helix-turn-helix transcriptional regulator n=1 Tax=Nocardia pseudovaccinii TaxID=189540 RepID=UPI003D8EED96
MTMLDVQAAAQWELGKLVHELDMQNNARMRERVAKLGLTPAHASALCELTGPMTMRELAGLMACEPSNATVVIDKLEAMRLIERRPHPTDRRAKQLTLTPEGAQRRADLLELLNEEPFVTGLTRQEQDILRDLLQRAISRAESPRAEGVRKQTAPTSTTH